MSLLTLSLRVLKTPAVHRSLCAYTPLSDTYNMFPLFMQGRNMWSEPLCVGMNVCKRMHADGISKVEKVAVGPAVAG